jgi:hypothetical protein
MSEPSPSTRFRGVALSIVAAGVALAPVILLAGSNLGFEPIAGAGGVAVESRGAGNLADQETLGASGVLPQTGRLSSDLMAAIDALPHQRSGRGLRLPLARRAVRIRRCIARSLCHARR